MIGALDPTNPDEEIPVIPLDMDAICNTARTTKIYSLEFDCSGVPFVWSGKSQSPACAELRARAELSDISHNFNRYRARLVAIDEVAA